MRGKKRTAIHLYIGLIVAGLLSLYLWPSLVTAMPLTAKHRLERAWQYAADVGRFQYQTHVLQIIHPTARLDNAGRHPTTRRMAAEGTIDRSNKAMQMRLWSPGSSRDGIELKVEEGRAYGRLRADGEWREVDDPTDIFAPGGDPLGFLVAAENVRQLGDESTAYPAAYAFDINSVRYAEYMRWQLQGDMQRSGELPPGLNLGVIKQYLNMKGEGEIWLDEAGWPTRQIIRLEFPPERGATNWVEAEIVTKFSGWDQPAESREQWLWLPARLWENPNRRLTDPHSPFVKLQSPETLRRIGLMLSVSLILAGLITVAVIHRRSRYFYGGLACAVIISMLVTPLMRSNRALAFVQRQQAKQAQIEQQQTLEQTITDRQAEISGRAFNPLVNPLAVQDQAPGNRDILPPNPQSPTSNPYALIPQLQSSCVYTDTDADCDGDGLTNGVELYELGTDPEDIDTDGDDISDMTEVEGFSYNGQQWYLDPLNPDSNGDKLLDGLECVELMDIDLETGDFRSDFTPGVCANSDSDSTPDLFDFDNDGDGVPDSVDSSPYAVEGSFTSDDPLNFNMTFNATDTPVFVDFDLRPTDPDHLWYTDNVLDWPDDDTEGQITRVHDITYADLSDYSDMADGADGDIYLTPLLELEITYDAANPSAGLPITATMSSGDITDYSDLSWLDTDALDEVGISVNTGESDDTMLVWLPLFHVEDEVGDTPVAWTGRMLYHPESGLTDLGNDQKIRLIWMVEALVDSCDTDGMTDDDDYDTYCADEDNWTTDSSIIQTYYDDFDLTGLNVREDHGLEAVIIAEPSGTGNAYYDDYLWHMANSLQSALIAAQTTGGGGRFTVGDIATYKDTWGMSELDVTAYSFEDELGLADIASTHSTDVLNSVFSSAATDDTATLLFAGEDTARVMAMGDGNSTISGNTLTVDLTGVSLDTTAQLRWSPYIYEGAGVWDTMEMETYMAELDTNLQNVLTADQIDILAGGETVDDYELAQAGAIGLAQSFYLSLYSGLSQVVAEDGQDYSDTALEDFSLGSDEPVTVIIQTLIEAIQDYYADLALVEALIYADNASSYAVNSLSATFASSLSEILGAVGIVVEGESSTTLSLAMQELSNYYKTTEVDTTDFTTVTSISALAGASYVTQSEALSEDLFSTDLSVPFTLLRVAQHIYYIKWGWTAYKTFNSLVSIANTAGQAGRTALSLSYASQAMKVLRTNAVWAVAVLVITLAVVWGLFAIGEYENDLEFAAALAQAIASTIVAVIMAVLVAIPVAGWLIAGIIGLIDSIVMLICALSDVEAGSDVDRWVCGGISGALTQAIVYVIFDQYIIADLEDDDRLAMALNEPTLSQKVSNGGFVSSNQLEISAVITNTISKAPLSGIGSAMDDFFDGHDHDELLYKSTFSYTLQSKDTDQHAGLSLDQLDWVDNTEVFTASGPFPFGESGINQSMELYLTESFYLPALECWGYWIQVCGREDYQDSYHTYLGDSFIFDVFPNTLDEFYRLAATNDDGYRLKWAGRFPTLADADGDDLLSPAVGGPDPDDSTWDTDQDGLSDYWEMDNGSDPEERDTDNDGLYDYWEAFYGTSLTLADTDGDGLTDGEEFFHSNSLHAYEDDNSTWSGGWTIVYDYDGSQPLQTLVSADPLDYDSDDDTILDNLEYIYGYNPNLASVLNVLSLNTEVDRSLVAAGGTVAYTATVKNELDNRVANGLLQAEFPVDTVQTTEIIGGLYPQMEANLAGTVTAPSLGQTEATSLTLRAGAVIDSSAVNKVFVLNLDEEAGATTFYDATSNRHDFTAYGDPVANSGYVTFDSNDYLGYSASDDFDQTAFSLEAWLNPSDFSGWSTVFNDNNDFQINLTSGGGYPRVWVEGSTRLASDTPLTKDEWNHLLVTFDQSTGEAAIYINGQLTGSATGVPAISRDGYPYNLTIGTVYQGEIDYIAMHDYALTKAEAQALFNSLAFYATFDQSCGSYFDAVSYQEIDCFTNSAYDKNLEDAPFTDYGIVGDSVSLVSVNPWGNYNGFGDRDFVQADETFSLAGDDGAFTIGMWLNKAADGGYAWEYHLLSLEVDSGDDLESYLEWSSDLQLSLGNCGSLTLAEDDYLPDWGWHHLGLTYDGNGILRAYSDGEEIATTTCSGLPDLETVNNLRLGSTNVWDDENRAFRGQVDELRLYNKELSAEEMEVLVKESARSLHLTFDEPPGQTTFADSSPNEFDGSCLTCPDSGLAGRNNQAIRLDANQVTLESADLLGLTEGNFTVMAWVKADTFGSATRSVLGTDSTIDREGLQLAVKNGYPYMSFYGTDNDLTGSTALNTGEWVHLAWRYEYESEQGSTVEEMTIFVNGVEDANTADRSAFIGTDTVYVGQSLGDNHFDGLIDDLVIVKEALSATEIQAIMAEAPLVNLHLDEDLNTTTFTDDSPGQYDATCSACPEAGSKGQIREAPVFAGNDSLSLPTIPIFDSSYEMSLGLWVKPTRTKGSVQYLINNGDTFGLSLEADSTTLDFNHKTGISACSTQAYYDPNIELIEDQWNHVFMTLEFDGADFIYTFYLNGSETNAVTAADWPCSDFNPLTIGDNFEGSLDEITIYDAALNSEEVAAIYDYQAAWYDVVEQHLITVDADDPQVTLDLPDYLADDTTWLTISAVDPGSDVEQVEVTVTPPGGGSYSDWASRSESGDGSNGAWMYEFVSAGAGQYTIEAVATDSVGHTGSASHTFWVDDTPPGATLNSSLTGAILTTSPPITDGSDTLTLFGAVSDDSSGVATNTVAVQLYDWQGASVEGVRYADSDGGSWEVDYPFSLPPYGQYEVELAVQDHVGNAYTGTVGTVEVDAYSPLVDVALADKVISTTGTVISGVATDLPYPAKSKALFLHLEESAGATEFVDSSRNHYTATCTACPIAGESGQYGNAVHFDGSDDMLWAETELDPAEQPFTALAWFNTDATGIGQQALIQQETGSGWRIWLYLTNEGRLGTNLGGGLFNSDDIAQAGNWHHAALSYDGAEARLYLDGILQQSYTTTVEAGTGWFVFGGDHDESIGSSGFFDGLMDEIVLYNTALSEDQIYDLAHPLDGGVASGQIRYRHLENSDLGQDEGDWHNLTLASPGDEFTAWEHTVPSDLAEGPYKIDLKATDTLGNETYFANAWNGEIDLSAPQLTLTYTLITGSYARVGCAASDYSITGTNWLCPAPDWSYVDQSADWFVDFFSPTTRSGGITTPLKTASILSDSMTACDIYGHCASLVVTDTTPLTEVSAILTPTLTAVFTDLSPIEIGGYVRSDNQIQALDVTVEGQSIYSITWGGGLTETTWTTAWTPPGGDIYEVEAILTTALGRIITDEAEMLITVLYPDLSIAKAATPASLLRAGETLTYTITVSNSGNGDAKGVVISDTLPAGVTGSDFYQNVAVITAGEIITRLVTGTVTGSEAVITNTASFSHSSGSGQADVAFDRCDYILVTNDNDSGPGSLRQAIADGCEETLITFASSYTIYLDSVLNITKNLTIDAADRDITVSGDSGGDGGRDVQVFNIASGSVVTFNQLSIVNGTALYGGGIYNAGALTLLDSVISNNRADYGYSGSGTSRGGGIYNSGALTISHSLFSGNSAANAYNRNGGAIYHTGSGLLVSRSVFSDNAGTKGGALYVESGSPATLSRTVWLNNPTGHQGGAIYSKGVLTLSNSTLAGNSTYNQGGAFYNGGTATINNSSFSENSAADQGSGSIYNAGQANLYLNNSLVANSPGDNYDCIIAYDSGTVSLSHSLVERGRRDCGTPPISGDPMLDDLADFGGDQTADGTPLFTFALLPGSPALDAGDDATCETTDQRDQARVGACDVGAFESQGFNLTYHSGGDQTTAIGTAFANPLTVTVTANAITEPVAGGEVDFTAPADGAGLAAAIYTASINSSGAAGAAVTANTIAGSYFVTATVGGGLNSVPYTLTNLCGTSLYTVTSNADDGAGTLRRGLNNSCAGGEIIFAADLDITLSSPLEIDEDVTIDSSGYAVTISGNNAVRLFEISSTATLTLRQLSLVDGLGLLNEGTLLIEQSILSGHITPALQNRGRAWLTNTTFSGNSGHISNTLSLTVSNSSLVDSSGDGLDNAGTLALRNSLIAGSSGADCLNSGTISLNHYNLIEDGACSPALSGDPHLSTLGDYGGQTPTYGLLVGSPALDAGDDATCAGTDQRDVARPQGGVCDIGAFESQGFSLSYVHGSGQRTALNTAFNFPLRVQVTANAITEPVGAGGVISYTGPTVGAGLTITQATASANASGLAGLSVTANGTYGSYVVTATTIGASEAITFALENYSCSIPQVTNGNDSGSGSLRQALADACDGAVITFDDDYTITLQSSLSTALEITIDGSGHNIIISGDANGNGLPDKYQDVRPFIIQSGGVVTMSHLSIISGSDQADTQGGGGAILIQGSGDLRLDHVLLRDSYGYKGGGAVSNRGSLTAINSVFLNNTADSSQGGGLRNRGSATLANCTFSGNRSGNEGGAIYHESGTLYLFNSSIVSNSTDYTGPGLYSDATLDIRNTLLAGNTGGSWQCDNLSGTLLATSGNNLTVGGSYNCAADQVSDLALGSFGDYDSLSWPYLPTYPLLLTSPALDAGDDATCAGDSVGGVDQRDESRLDGEGCDVGAFEAQFALTITGGDGQSTTGGTVFAQPLSVTLSSLNGEPLGSGGVITFAGPGLAADYPAALNGSGATSATITASLLAGSHIVTASGPGMVSPALFSLTNINLAPVITPATFYVDENVATGLIVGVVDSSDGNGATLTHTITAGNTGDAFAIDSTGQISVAASLDYETTPQYLLTVAASDGLVTDTATITVNINNLYADLEVVKTVNPATSQSGDIITYTLVFSNSGGELATGVILTDIIPAEVTPLAYETDPEAEISVIENPGPAYEWSISDLSPGQRGAITITGLVTDGLEAMIITNTATITGTAVESDTTDNRSAAGLANCGNAVTVTNANNSGDGSLRWAIATTCPGGEITFAADFTITLTAQLEVDQALTLNGEGQSVTLSGNDATRLFYINDGGLLTLSQLSLINGYAGQDGGAVHVTDGGALTVLDSSFSGNESGWSGGAIYAAWNSRLEVSRSSFSENWAADWGGAIYSEDVITITESDFISNTADPTGGSGGAISADNGGSISDSNFSHNRAESAGAIDAFSGQLEISHSTFSHNQASYGGAIYGYDSLIVTGSIFTHNQALSSDGGAIYSEGSLHLSDSVLAYNRASDGDGGAIGVEMDLALTNTTFYSNTATGQMHDDGGWIYYTGRGGAIYNQGWGEVTINNATFISHTASYSASVFASEGGTVNLRNSLMAGESSLPLCEAILTENSHNLIADGSCSPMLAVDPLAGSFGDYGGQTETIPLLPGSPAIDAGEDATCETADQRGMGRVGSCDIGAFESQGFSLAYSGGDDQSTLINTAFAQPLALTVTGNILTEPVAGGYLSFSGPASGAGLNPTVLSQTIPANGLVSAAVTANGLGGGYVVTATTAGAGSPLTFSLTNTIPTADLTLTKMVTPATARPGQTITYTLTFSNGGDAATGGAIITDYLPLSLSVQSVISSSPAAITRTSYPAMELFALSELAVGEGGSITLTAVLSDNLAAGAVVTNTAVITEGGTIHDSAAAGVTISNAAPTLALIGDQAITESVELTFTVIATDANGDSLAFGLLDAPAGATISQTSGLFSWTPTEADGSGLFTITVVVSDSGGLTDSQAIQVTVNEADSPPTLTLLGDQAITETETLTFTLTATDTDIPAQSLTFGLVDAPAGAVFNTTGGVFTWTPSELQGGDSYTMTALVTDTTGLTDSQQLVITVLKGNSPPTLAPITSSQEITETMALSFTATATDTDTPAQILTFSLTTLPLLDAPAGASIESDTGLFTWTPTEADGPGSYFIVVVVTDPEGASDSQLVSFTVLEDNTPPLFDPISPTQTITEGESLTFTVTATDTDLQSLVYGVADGPDGISLGHTDGLFSWTPTEAQGPGRYTATLLVSDGSLTDSQSVVLTVTEVNTAPTLAPIADQTVNETETLTFTAVATDTDIPTQTLSYSLGADAPAGATIDAASGLFSWTPTVPGRYTITLIAADDGQPILTDTEQAIIEVSGSIAILVGPPDGNTDEDGATAAFTVTLDSQPTAPVTITLGSADPTEGVAAPTRLIFDATNWNIAQTVTITGQDDAVADGPITYTVAFLPALSDDANYNGLLAAPVTLVNMDNDTATLTLNISSTTRITEGETAVYSITLSSQPTGTITITLAISGEASITPTVITFTPDNWDIPQLITITAINDYLVEDDPGTLTITHTITADDPAYTGLAPIILTIPLIDGEPPIIYLPLMMKEQASLVEPDLVIDRIEAAGDSLQVTIQNRGEAPVWNAFWIDLYLDPSETPTYNRTWRSIADQGAVWGVVASGLPLGPGERLTVAATSAGGDAYYWPTKSNLNWPISTGAIIYAQVDSANLTTAYGGVPESNEANNVGGGMVATEANSVPVTVIGTPQEEPASLPARL